MNKSIFLFLALCLLSANILAQSGSNPSKKLGIGFQVNQFQRDFGIGVHVVSPYFVNSKIALRLSGNLQWLEHASDDETTWTPYANFQLGIRGRQFVVDDKVIMYGEGGATLLLPNSTFSNVESKFGGYGLFGFEFYPTPRLAYFLELGGMGTGATAEKITGKPIYSNGFVTSVGFRFGL
jgi:hypothetical protein